MKPEELCGLSLLKIAHARWWNCIPPQRLPYLGQFSSESFLQHCIRYQPFLNELLSRYHHGTGELHGIVSIEHFNTDSRLSMTHETGIVVLRE